MKRRGIEIVKTLLIVLLLLSALILTLAANLFTNPLQVPWVASLARPLAGLLGYNVPEQPVLVQRPTLTDASQPTLISIRSAAGRASCYGDFAKLDAAFEVLGSFLAGGLDTASDPVSLNRRQYQAALQEPGVFFAYPCSIPVPVLGAWLDADVQSDQSAARYALHLSATQVRLLVDCGDEIFSYATQVDPAALSAALEGYPADGTFFAFESSDPVYRRLDGLTLLSDRADTPPAAGVSANPCDEAFTSQAANLLGFNPYSDSNYRDDSGVTYTESDCTLRIGTDGALWLRNLGLSDRYTAASDSDADRIEFVRQTLADLTASVAGDGRLLLTQLLRDGDTVTMRFEYFLGGIAVSQPSGSAAEAVFTGDTLSSLRLRVRTYTHDAAQTVSCLPARQAAALVPSGGQLLLRYADPGTGALLLGWTS